MNSPNNKKYLKCCIFFIVTLIGIIGLNAVPLSVTKTTFQTVTTDGVVISYNLYTPEGSLETEMKPVVIMGHGVMVNKEMMTNFAVEIASQGYIVAALDWRGHGRSTGDLSVREGLHRDLEAVIRDIPFHVPADMERIALLGYSMGGFPTYVYAVDNSEVKAWIGVGTAPDGSISDEKNPQNVLVIIAKYDEAFSPERAKEEMVSLTGVGLDEIEFEKVYGHITEGTARKIHVVPGADHLTTPWNSDFVMTATTWVTQTFDGVALNTGIMVFHQRLLFFLAGLIGFIGFLSVFSSVVAEKYEIESEYEHMNVEQPIKSFVVKYYVVTLLSIFAMVLFLPLFLTSLPFAAFLTTLNGGLGIGILVYCWLLTRRSGISLRQLMKRNLFQDTKIWVFSLVITGVFMCYYYLLVGLNYLGVIPSNMRIPYLILYFIILFFVFFVYSLFVQKVSTPFFHKNIHIRNSKVKFAAISLVNFVLIYSWFFIVVMVPCIIIRNFFIAMILILMIPIFLFMSFFSVYMEKVTKSAVPSAVLHGVWLGFLVTTLTPYATSLMFIG